MNFSQDMNTYRERENQDNIWPDVRVSRLELVPTTTEHSFPM